MKLLGSNDDRQVRGGVDQSVPRTQDDVAAAAAAVGYVFPRPSPVGVQPGVGSSGGSIHDVAAAEYAAQFAQKQARWACGDEHTIDVSAYFLFAFNVLFLDLEKVSLFTQIFMLFNLNLKSVSRLFL